MKSSKRYCCATFHLFNSFNSGKKNLLLFTFQYISYFESYVPDMRLSNRLSLWGPRFVGCGVFFCLLVWMKFRRCVGFRFQWDELKLFQNFCFCWRCKFLGNYYPQIQQKIEPSWILLIPQLYIQSGKWSITGLRTIFSWWCPPPLKNN